MLERPAIEDQTILACLSHDYGIPVARLDFLPLGADQNTAVFRAETATGDAYFVKVRFGSFDELAVTLPRYLSDLDIRQIIPPLTTQTGTLWATLGDAALILYPFIVGQSGRRVRLSEANWHEFGAALGRVHAAALPLRLHTALPRDAYSGRWAATLRQLLDRARSEAFTDPVAGEMAAYLRAKHSQILHLIHRAEELGRELQNRGPDLVLCHGDIHASNVLVGEDGSFHMVDWDAPLLAPKERDLMYIGGAQGFVGGSAAQEEEHFYRGYGQVKVDWSAVAYYRYARIVEDLALYGEQLLLSAAGGADRPQALIYVRSNFLPDGTIDAARRADAMQYRIEAK